MIHVYQIRDFGSFSLFPPPYDSLQYVPPIGKECLRLFYIHLLLANLSLFSQSIDLVITNDTFYWLLLLKSPLSQSEALLDKSWSALLECAINSVYYVPPFCFGGNSERDPRFLA